MEEKDKQKDVGTMKRNRTRELRILRNNLILVSGNAIWEHSMLLSCADIRSYNWVYALQHQGSVTTKGKADFPSLGWHPRMCWYLRTIQNWPRPSSGHHGIFIPRGVREGELTPCLVSFSNWENIAHCGSCR